MYEPTYSNTSHRYESGSSSSDSESVEDHDSLNDSTTRERRSKNTSWCKCGKCKSMETEEESVCCEEMLEIEEERFQGKKCISEVCEFEAVCLNSAVLKTALIAYVNGLKNSKINGTFDNKNMRFSGYKQYTFWIHNKLGKGVRRVIPSCVVWAIRDRFPDILGNYVRFENR